jgi:hypothetical protein
MKTTNSRSHAAILEKYRIALVKAESNPGILQGMAKFGYNSELLEEGKELLRTTREIYDVNIHRRDELSFSHVEFKRQKEQFERTFRLHRNMAKLVFNNESLISQKLAIKGKYHKEFFQWSEAVLKFYTVALEDQEILHRLQRLNLTKEELGESLVALERLLDLYGRSIMFKGDSQDSTQTKDEAFKKISEWMSVFYGVARLALSKNPELLEALRHSA